MIFDSPIAETRVRKWTGERSGANPPAPKSEEPKSEKVASLEKSRFNEAYMVPFYWGALDG